MLLIIVVSTSHLSNFDIYSHLEYTLNMCMKISAGKRKFLDDNTGHHIEDQKEEENIRNVSKTILVSSIFLLYCGSE